MVILTSKYIYKGIDITLDIYEKLARIVEQIALQEDITFDEAFIRFARTDTYEVLANPYTLMWSESVPFIVDEYYLEIA